MTIKITSAPAAITREAYTALVRGAGFDPEDVIELRFAIEGVYATVYARDDEGEITVVTPVDGSPADTGYEYAASKHTVFVKVVG